MHWLGRTACGFLVVLNEVEAMNRWIRSIARGMIMRSAVRVWGGHIVRLLLMAGVAMAPMAHQLAEPDLMSTDPARLSVSKINGSSKD